MAKNSARLKSIHHVELWVGNARQAAYYYRQAFGFSQFAYAGLETGRRDAASYALQQGKARLVPVPGPALSGPRRFGLHEGEVWMSDDFNAPLPDAFWLNDQAR